MGWRYKAGLVLIGTVVLIWVISAEVTQGIFADYKQPFAVTYLGASLMVIYLPISALKDWMRRFLRRRASRSGKIAETVDESYTGVDSPLKLNGVQEILELEMLGSLTRKGSEIDLSSQEEGRPLIFRCKDEVDVRKHNREPTAREIAAYGFYLAPIWFVTETSRKDALKDMIKNMHDHNEDLSALENPNEINIYIGDDINDEGGCGKDSGWDQ